MSTFNALGLSPNLLKGIEDLNFITPTPIQQKVIPTLFTTTSDVIGLARTGTGKTAAFGLPLLDQTDISSRVVQTLILSPTRELCVQIAKDLQSYSRHMGGIQVTSIYGGSSMDKQIQALKRGPQILVATPGRMLDLIRRKAAKVHSIKNLVLDEADEMLNMGFREELDEILETTPAGKRTLLFSATMSSEVARISKNYLKTPEKITIGKQNSGAENIRHLYYQVHNRDRYDALKRIADIHPQIYGLIFCRTRAEAREVSQKLMADGYSADALHGELSQAQRDHVMNRFRSGALQMLVATDVAARGLDVSDISHVINYTLPDDPEIYTHRSGRTGRAEKSGTCISLITDRETRKIQQIQQTTGSKCEKMPVPTGEEVCTRQIYNMIHRMENTPVDEEKISPFMETVSKKLEWMTKEDIIKHFVSTEFNRFLKYYENAPDLNKHSGKAETTNRGKREKGTQRKRQTRKTNGNEREFTRFFLNVGKKDGLIAKKVIGLVNDHTKIRNIAIGEIDLKDSFSFFEVDAQFGNTIQQSLHGKPFNGREMIIQAAEVREKQKKGKKKHKQFTSTDNRK